MKHLLLTTIAAVVLVGCGGPSVDIHEGARTENIEAVKQAIADGADVNAKANDGWTPLHWAAWKSHKEIAELLLANGADVNAKNDVGDTPLDYWAEMNTEGETADLLRKHGGKKGEELKGGEPVAVASQAKPSTAKAPDISIHDAVESGNIEVVKQHIAAGVDVNAKDAEGWTPLHVAAKNGHKEIAELLIAKSANVNAKNDFGRTPLDLATVLRRDTETADLLRKHGGKTSEELKAEGK